MTHLDNDLAQETLVESEDPQRLLRERLRQQAGDDLRVMWARMPQKNDARKCGSD